MQTNSERPLTLTIEDTVIIHLRLAMIATRAIQLTSVQKNPATTAVKIITKENKRIQRKKKRKREGKN